MMMRRMIVAMVGGATVEAPEAALRLVGFTPPAKVVDIAMVTSRGPGAGEGGTAIASRNERWSRLSLFRV